MDDISTIELGREAIWVFLIISAPIMLVALGVGLIVSFFQALTQIQENTLSFVPKIFAIFICLLLVMPFMLTTLSDYTEKIFTQIIEDQ